MKFEHLALNVPAPHEMALIGLLEVVLGPLWAWLGAGEAISSATLQGGALVLAALLAGIAAEILATPGVLGLHDLKTRKTGDMILADVHLEIDGQLTVTEGHDIAHRARLNVMARHPVLYLMTHVDPAPGTAKNSEFEASTASRA